MLSDPKIREKAAARRPITTKPLAREDTGKTAA